MSVCPKCHNTMVYGMNCCTGKRLLNITPSDPEDEIKTSVCDICHTYRDAHDPWKHAVMERIGALEKEVAVLKQRGLKI